jgi:hypothetical protein
MKLPIPTAVLQQHTIVLGKTRSGKSSKMRLIVESLLDAERPTTIIDPKGDWHGLRSSANGKKAGYPVVIFGGSHADVPLNAHAGAHIAELVATGNRPSLIDVSDLMIGERTRFFVDFAATFFKMTKGSRVLVIDEVHNFAPQGRIMDPDAGKMLHWANRLASEGSGRGITLIAASQRPQKVSKDFVTSCETLIACRVIHKLDRDAIKDWIDGCADPAKGKEVLVELATMPRNEAWVWSPEIEFGPKRVAWPMFKTFDSFDPRKSRTAEKLKGWAEVNLDEVREKLATVVEEAQAKDPAYLKARIRELEQQLKKKMPSATTTDQRATQQQYAQVKRLQAALENVMKFVVQINAIDFSKSTDLDPGELAKAMKAAVDQAMKLVDAKLAGRQKTLESLQRDAGRLIAAAEKLLADDKVNIKLSVKEQESFKVSTMPPPKAPRAAREPLDNGSLPKGEAAVLAACIMYPNGVSREQLTVLTAYKRSSRDAYIQRLRERGYIETGDLIRATESGLAALPNVQPLPMGDELRDYWLAKLPEGERKILAVLIEAHPKPMDRAALDQAGYQRSSRDAYLQRLRAKELVVEPTRGQVKASDNLFT